LDYQELYRIAYEQEKHHFVQLVATGQERHKELMLYWQKQRCLLAPLWMGRKGKKEQDDRAARPEPEPKPEPKANEGVDCIRTYPDLSQCCLCERLDLPLRLWYLLRQHNSDIKGDGWFTESEVFDLSIGNKRQTRTWLKKGLTLFWFRYGGKYKLAGLGAVVEKLAVKLPKNCVDVPRKHLGSLRQFRAALFASWVVHSGDDGVTISQAALSELFGRSARTLRRWATMTDLTIIPNLAAAPIPKSKDEALERYANGMMRYPNGTLQAMGWQDDGKGEKGRPNLVWFERHGDDVLLTWKMANTYSMAWAPGPKTTLQRNASKRAPDLRGTGANVKMYFDKDAKGGAVARAIQRKQGPVYLKTGKMHPKTGAMQWSKQA